ncbi:MAG: ATP-binding protein [Pseudomonadota bacterium]|nr:ATP-binding protein [Pseudomonadota bacterium]
MTENKITDFARQAHLEMEHLAVESAGFTAIVGFLISLIYGLTVFYVVSRTALLSWLGLMFAIMTLRVLSQKLLCQTVSVEQNWRKYFSFFKLLILVNGAGWGVAVIVVFPAEPYHQMVLICILLGVAAGALSSMAPVIKVFKLYVGLLLVPLIGRLFYENGSHFVILAVFFSFYIVTLYVMAGKIHRSLFSSISLRLENEALLNDVFTAKEQVGKVNLDLQAEVDEHQKARHELEEAWILTEQANQVKSRFMNNISHELKTPMTGIVGFTYQLQQTVLDSKQESLLQKLDESSGKLHYLIKNLLDFSELESGGLALDEQLFNLNLMLDELVVLFKPQAQDKGLKFQLSLTENEQKHELKLPEWVIGDKARLKQILGNLLDNAIKFTDTGSMKFSIKRQPRDPGSSEERVVLEFCVCDTGPGVPEKVRETIFSTFQQADDSLTRVHGGTGVGLSLAQKLVTLMAGEIRYESVSGEGSRFYVKIPLKLGENPIAANAETAVSDKETDLPKILIVDDNLLNLNLLSAILKEKNLNPYMAKNGLQALEIIAHEKVDLIFMDLQMPRLDGLKTTQIVRCLESGDQNRDDQNRDDDLSGVIPQTLWTNLQLKLADIHIVIIAITAHLVRGTKKECLAAGMEDCLRKPYQPEEIFAIITNYFPATVNLMSQPPTEQKNLPVKSEDRVASRILAETYLRENYFLDDSSVAAMLETLGRSLADNFNEAERALADNDLIKLGQIAHSLKGSIANIGFSELAEQAREIEIGVHSQPELPYVDMVAQLKRNLSKLM